MPFPSASRQRGNGPTLRLRGRTLRLRVRTRRGGRTPWGRSGRRRGLACRALRLPSSSARGAGPCPASLPARAGRPWSASCSVEEGCREDLRRCGDDDAMVPVPLPASRSTRRSCGCRRSCTRARSTSTRPAARARGRARRCPRVRQGDTAPPSDSPSPFESRAPARGPKLERLAHDAHERRLEESSPHDQWRADSPHTPAPGRTPAQRDAAGISPASARSTRASRTPTPERMRSTRYSRSALARGGSSLGAATGEGASFGMASEVARRAPDSGADSTDSAERGQRTERTTRTADNRDRRTTRAARRVEKLYRRVGRSTRIRSERPTGTEEATMRAHGSPRRR